MVPFWLHPPVVPQAAWCGRGCSLGPPWVPIRTPTSGTALLASCLSCLPRAVVLNQGFHVSPPPPQKFDNVWRCFMLWLFGHCYWHLMSRGQRCCWESCRAQASPTAKIPHLVLRSCMRLWAFQTIVTCFLACELTMLDSLCVLNKCLLNVQNQKRNSSHILCCLIFFF